jgi:hypothetical protein
VAGGQCQLPLVSYAPADRSQPLFDRSAGSQTSSHRGGEAQATGTTAEAAPAIEATGDAAGDSRASCGMAMRDAVNLIR